MQKSKIEWCNYTWNPVTGCLHGCEYCYARGQANRFKGFDRSACTVGDILLNDLRNLVLNTPLYKFDKCGDKKKAPYPFNFTPTFHRYRLDEPAKLKKPSNIFVCSMADLFGGWVPDEWIKEVFKACEAAPQHRYLFLTKNPKRYNNYYSFHNNRPDNFYFGASATNYNDMVAIRQTLANSLNFLSLEPLHGDVDIGKFIYENSGHLDWVIIGAETGNRKDKIIPKREWIENIVEQCRAANVPVLMKNSLADIWGGELIQEYPWL